MAISSLLSVAGGALLSQQTAINIAGANIANVNTAGYSRQQAVMSAVGSVDALSGFSRLGVEVTGIQRAYDQFLADRIAVQKQNVGYAEARESALEGVQVIFNDASGSLGDAMNTFWNAWDDLSLNPDGQLERENLLDASERLTVSFHEAASSLISARDEAEARISDAVGSVNGILSGIAQLNSRITAADVQNISVNSLRDQRVELINELAGYMDISYFENADGSVNVYMGSGQTLAEGNDSRQLSLQSDPANGFYSDIVISGGSQTVVTDSISSGRIGALLEIRDSVIPEYLDRLNTLATTLADAVNTQHQAGYDANGNAGENFFDPSADAAALAINAAIAADIDMIAASSTAGGSDGENARVIAAINEDALINDATLGDSYAAMIGQIALDLNNAGSAADRQSLVMDQLITMRDTVSGVSLDEEMIQLMKFQLGYNAAARLTQTVNEMLDVLMNLGQ
ncbi:MAG: flagellar hook-associated protein FlgK [Desulfobacterales bacterium]|nr:flagellar hook-associated protein FlgK [Desulfobacterales bacterium]MDD3080917.1 flagellar hook-associated protein FlgK [Desulfobacterales bacterium]